MQNPCEIFFSVLGIEPLMVRLRIARLLVYVLYVH